MVAAFRPAASRQLGGPYRGDHAAAPEPALAELITAARAAGLAVHEVPGGFDVRADDRAIRVRVRDRSRVALASIDLVDTGHETLVFQLALALVPVYGPIAVTEALFGTFIVDGRADAEALRGQRGERIKALARRIQERIAASQPDWDELARRL